MSSGLIARALYGTGIALQFIQIPEKAALYLDSMVVVLFSAVAP